VRRWTKNIFCLFSLLIFANERGGLFEELLYCGSLGMVGDADRWGR